MTLYTTNWQKKLTDAFSNPTDLLRYLEISPSDISMQAHANFAMRIPKSYAACMEKGNLEDPLLKQVLPIQAEMTNPDNYQQDPVGDLSALIEGCIIHKYRRRVLLILTGGCAINCRFCFRRNFPYADVQLTKQKEITALHYIQSQPHINEVILSGGDPLLLSDHRLETLINQLSKISHVRRIRLHTRIPIVLPSRLTDTLISLFNDAPLPIIIVTHCNHANELSQHVVDTCLRLKQKNITLLNQSVLLKGINNQIETLQHLSEKLFSAGILPYYLHVLDKAKGTAHFDITQAEALTLHQQLQRELPGFLVPKLVREQAGEASKTLLI